PPVRSPLRDRAGRQCGGWRRRAALAPWLELGLDESDAKQDAASEGIRQEPGGDMATVCDCKRFTILRRRLPRLTGCPAEGSDNFDRRFLCQSASFACQARPS